MKRSSSPSSSCTVLFRFCTIVTLLFSSVYGIELHFSGEIPHLLDSLYLAREYHRIFSTISGSSIDPSPEPLSIIFYQSRQERKRGIFLPEWGGGGALGTDSIVLPIDKPSAFYRSDIHHILLHEMVHIALVRNWGHLRLPRWFHEGVAMTLSGEVQFDEQITLSRAILTRSLIPLDSMEYLNRFPHVRAQIAYSQSHVAVQFLLSTYGNDLIPELLRESRVTRSFSTACFRVFGLTEQELEKLVRKEILSRYRYLFFISDYSLYWVGVLILAVVAFLVTRVRNRAKRRRMEREEAEEIDSDIGSPGNAG